MVLTVVDLRIRRSKFHTTTLPCGTTPSRFELMVCGLAKQHNTTHAHAHARVARPIVPSLPVARPRMNDVLTSWSAARQAIRRHDDTHALLLPNQTRRTQIQGRAGARPPKTRNFHSQLPCACSAGAGCGLMLCSLVERALAEVPPHCSTADVCLLSA